MRRAPWDLLADFKPSVPLILAGGLTPENIGDAIRTVRPWGVDACSRIESVPGKKDHKKMSEFLQAAKAALLA